MLFDLVIAIILILIPILISSVLSAVETSITAISTAKLHKLKNDGNSKAVIISKLREDKESLISTILLTNNACNILASSAATAILIKFLGDGGVFYATIIMTIIIIIFAEILPKTYAISNPERVALNLAFFIQSLVRIFYPLTCLINKLVAKFINYLTRNKNKKNLVSPTEEIKGAIELHHQEGAVDQSDKFMLDGVFYLGETKVFEVMTHRKNMTTLNIDLPLSEFLIQIKKIHYTRIPVWQDKPDNIIGILNTRDLLKKILEQPNLNSLNLSNLIIKPMFISENINLDEVLDEFRTKKTKFAIAIDEYGEIQGLITLMDIIEEVIGEVHDEQDPNKNGIELLDKNSCIVKGEVAIRDLNRKFLWNLPDDDAYSVAGLLLNLSEKIPEIDETIYLDNFKFTILEKEFNQLKMVKIEINNI